jgi:hypothetical protein
MCIKFRLKFCQEPEAQCCAVSNGRQYINREHNMVSILRLSLYITSYLYNDDFCIDNYQYILIQGFFFWGDAGVRVPLNIL